MRVLLLVLLSAVIFKSTESSRYSDEECEEEDNVPNVGNVFFDVQQAQVPVRKSGGGSTKPVKGEGYEFDGADEDEPTDDEILKYEDTNQKGICILKRGKCPEGNWRMFKRHNETVCLTILGSSTPIDAVTAGRVCRQQANGRIMSIDNFNERRWLYNQPLVGNHSYPTMLLAGYRNRKCYMDPLSCRDRSTIYDAIDRTADPNFLFSRWYAGPQYQWHYYPGTTYLRLDSCLTLQAFFGVDDNVNHIQDWQCGPAHNTFLCGVTVL